MRNQLESQTYSNPAEASNRNRGQSLAGGDLQVLCNELSGVLARYAQQHPEMAALACIGVGFYLGWKLKP